MHPRMHVALHGNEFRLVVALANRRRTRRLRFIPLAIPLRLWMNVVDGLILVGDLQFLIDLEGQQVRDVPATLLRESRGIGRSRVDWRSRGNVDDHILQAVADAGYDGFRELRRRIHPGAGWFPG